MSVIVPSAPPVKALVPSSIVPSATNEASTISDDAFIASTRLCAVVKTYFSLIDPKVIVAVPLSMLTLMSLPKAPSYFAVIVTKSVGVVCPSVRVTDALDAPVPTIRTALTFLGF